MIRGFVNDSCEASISLVVMNKSNQTQVIEAVIDTGFTGFLSLPSKVITKLDLPWTGVDRGTLGDGSEASFKVYAARVVWDDDYQNIPVNEAETDPLVGMGLLYGYDLRIQTIEGGSVTIRALSEFSDAKEE